MSTRLSLAITVLLLTGIVAAQAVEKKVDPPAAGGPKSETAPPKARITTPVIKLPPATETDPLSPQASLAALETPADLEVQQLLTEPLVRQPISLSFDERGRLWVVQYLQYPHPAGLKALSRDMNWRVQYDRVPLPPPHHFVGADRVTIHEDTDGDGVFDSYKTFVEGLSLVTSVARGRGGVWVLNPPYLLFYPDRNNDDIPDGDPEVHLEGFGFEDSHSCTNSLRWGPDGWLYASQGSTVSGSIKRPGLDKEPYNTMGQLIWRYHPETRRYEVFAEGGGNAFGVEIDSKGRLFSGTNGSKIRGYHYVQGGYSIKGFDKHGPLSNPYAFGYFEGMRHPESPRFTHAFVIYEGGSLPPVYDRKMFAVNPLLHQVHISDVQPDGSSLQTKDVGLALQSRDPWFVPVDIELGPDGGLYIADWYDRAIAHLRHHEGDINKETGRVYRLMARGAQPLKPFDLSQLSTQELIGLLGHKNRWHRQTVLRLLGDRKDRSAIPELTLLLFGAQGQLALESLWALNLCGGLNEAWTLKALDHPDPYVRLWTARLMCDARQVSPAAAAKLAELAHREPNVEARSQLACSARRLPVAQGLPIIRELLAKSEDVDDPHIPLLLWWAIEHCATADPSALLALLENKQNQELWNLPIVQQFIEERLMRRFALAGTRKDLQFCTRLLQASPGAEHTKRMMAGFEAAFVGRSVAELPTELLSAMTKYGEGSPIIGLRQGKQDAVEKTLTFLNDPKADKSLQLQYVQILGEINQPASVHTLLKLATESSDSALRSAALLALQRYNSPNIGPAVVANYSGDYANLTDDVRSAVLMLLTSRKDWARQLVEAVDSGKIDARTVPPDIVARLQLHASDSEIAALLQKHWGDQTSTPSSELKQEVTRLLGVIETGTGVPKAGRELFMQQCGKCHTLHGKGGQVGPDLTSYKRDDLLNMVRNIVDPSAEIREGFNTYILETSYGRVITGLLVEQDDKAVTLRTNDGQLVTTARSDIEGEMRVAPKSLMPEGLLKQYNDDDIRDLFAYLRSSQPLLD